MVKKCEEILKKLNSNLDKLEVENTDILHKSEQGIKIAKLALEHIRQLVANHDFNKPSTEIHFFKNVKPQIFSKLIYYVKLFNIESKKHL